MLESGTQAPGFSQHHTALLQTQLSGVPAVFCGSQTALQTIAKAFKVL